MERYFENRRLPCPTMSVLRLWDNPQADCGSLVTNLTSRENGHLFYFYLCRKLLTAKHTLNVQKRCKGAWAYVSGREGKDLGFWGRVIPVDGNGGPAEMYLSCFLWIVLLEEALQVTNPAGLDFVLELLQWRIFRDIPRKSLQTLASVPTALPRAFNPISTMSKIILLPRSLMPFNCSRHLHSGRRYPVFLSLQAHSLLQRLKIPLQPHPNVNFPGTTRPSPRNKEPHELNDIEIYRVLIVNSIHPLLPYHPGTRKRSYNSGFGLKLWGRSDWSSEVW